MTLTELALHSFTWPRAALRPRGGALPCNHSRRLAALGVKKLEDELGWMIYRSAGKKRGFKSHRRIGERHCGPAQEGLEESYDSLANLASRRQEPSCPRRFQGRRDLPPSAPTVSAPQLPQLHKWGPENCACISKKTFTRWLLRDNAAPMATGRESFIALLFNEADVLTKPLYDEPFSCLIPRLIIPWADRDKCHARGSFDDNKLLDWSGESTASVDQMLEPAPACAKV